MTVTGIRGRGAAGYILWLLLLLFPLTTSAETRPFPLEPADTLSPRSTLNNLVDNVTQAHRLFQQAYREHAESSGLSRSDAVRDYEARIMFHLNRAVGSLDVSDIPRATRPFVTVEAVLQIKEVLDRVPRSAFDALPDQLALADTGATRWRLPHTGMSIVKISEGPRKGEFLFDRDTVARAEAMYQAVQHLPYVNRDTPDLLRTFVSTPGRLLPPKWLLWVEDLPDWMQTFHFGKALWQWIALVLTLLLAILVPVLVSRWLRRFAAPGNDLLRALRRLMVPLSALLALWCAEYFLVWQINFSGQSLVIVLKSLLVPITLVGAYVSYLLVLLAVEGLISSPRIDTASLDANMLRMIAGLVGGSLGLGVVFYGANDLGVPLVPLVASLGVGGLAVALAARPTIENLIGGIILYIDRPVSVGDFCSFGDHMGTVEAIGMRSIQLRARDRTVITVPNASFADMEIINWARCDMMQIITTIGVRYETRPDQVRHLLARLREMCLAHPKIHNDTARVRFSGYGDSSQDITIRVYALTRDWNEYFAIQEDVLLRLADIVEESGTGFAFPSQTLYLGRDDGIDGERSDAVMATVEEWRATGQLPFPNMARDKREALIDTLDYPPRGSPDSRQVEVQGETAPEPLSMEESDESVVDDSDSEPKR